MYLRSLFNIFILNFYWLKFISTFLTSCRRSWICWRGRGVTTSRENMNTIHPPHASIYVYHPIPSDVLLDRNHEPWFIRSQIHVEIIHLDLPDQLIINWSLILSNLFHPSDLSVIINVIVIVQPDQCYYFLVQLTSCMLSQLVAVMSRH